MNDRKASRGRQQDGSANPIDSHVGARVRLRRTLAGMSQEKLGEALGLTFQQVQKYERGANRISASRLYDLARVLDVPMAFFFDALDPVVAAASPSAVATGSVHGVVNFPVNDPLHSREMLEVARHFMALPPSLRSHVAGLVKAMDETHAAATRFMAAQAAE